MTRKPALAPLLRKWQRALHLRDWDITVEYVETASEETHDLWIGNCRVDVNKGTANIRILNPKVRPHSVEATIKHELLHVALWDFVGQNDALRALEERFIERIVPLLRTR